MSRTENHPFRDYINEDNKLKGGFLPAGLKKLIIGTFPPEIEYVKKGKGFFYYSSNRNHFWNRFDNNFNRDPGYRPLKKTSSRNANESYEENRKRKEAFLKSKKIGSIDIFSKVARRVEGSTKDSDLIPIENIFQNGNFQAIIKTENIDRVCCVYSLAYDVLKTEMLKSNEFKVKIVQNQQTANGEKLLVEAFGKSFEVTLLYPATRSRHKGYKKDQQYRHFLSL